MGWEATLLGVDGKWLGEWDYTHNTNNMVNAIVHPGENTDIDVFTEVLFPHANGRTWLPWWRILDGMSGADGAAYLAGIIGGLEAEPWRFREMNPANGWGNYDDLLALLVEMRIAVPPEPSTWEVSG